MAIKFLLATTGMQINMVSSWTDELYCSILKDGSISLRASKDGEDEYGGRWWFPSRRGIKTPKQFVDTIFEIDEIDTDNWSIQEDILPVLFEHAPLFATLTNLYLEIDDNQEEADLDFFLFSQKVILSSKVDLPNNFKSSVKLLEIIFNFVKKQFQSTGQLPRGQHALMGTSISFPNKVIRSKKEHLEFRKEQAIKTHVRNADWKIRRTRLHGFAMSKQHQDISDFCRNYFEQHKELPVGKYKIGQTVVTFNVKT